MTMTLASLGGAIAENPVLLLIIVLCLGATVVNGATDAPNAIATVVGTKAMQPSHAIMMAAVGNFVGLIVITAVNTAVAGTIFGMVDFGGDNHACVVVSDDGPGIPLNQRERVFERFYRIDPSRSRQTGGTGLGLAIVKHVAESMGGTISVGDSETGGAKFTLTLPAE